MAKRPVGKSLIDRSWWVVGLAEWIWMWNMRQPQSMCSTRYLGDGGLICLMSWVWEVVCDSRSEGSGDLSR